MQIVRVAFENGQRAVGLKLPLPIINMLEEDWRAKMDSACMHYLDKNDCTTDNMKRGTG
jgi:hypothetical protein